MASLPHAWLFAAALSAPGDVEVVKFTATWCAPCKAMEPVLEQVARQGYPVRRIDVDQRRDLAEKYRVSSVPTLLIVSGGQVVDRVEGAIPLEPLLARLNSVTGSARVSSPTQPTSPNQQLAATAGPSLPQHAAAPGPQPTASAAGNNAVENMAMQSTVRLRIEDANGQSYGTGTVVDVHGSDALVLTCGHIFATRKAKDASRSICSHRVRLKPSRAN